VYSALRFTTSGAEPEMLALLEEAVAARDRVDDAVRAHLLARLGVHIAFVDHARHQQLAAEAQEAASRSGDPGARAVALQTSNYAVGGVEPDAVQESYGEVARLAAMSGDVDLQGTALQGLVIAALYAGDRTALERELAALTKLADESRSPFMRYVDLNARACAAIMEGRYDEGERLVSESLTVAHRTGDSTNVSTVGAVWFPLLREQGRSAEIEAATRRMVESQPLVHAYRAGLMTLLADQGKLDEAAEHLDHLAARGAARVADDAIATYTLGACAEVIAVLGEIDLAGPVSERLDRRRGAAAIIGSGAYHGAVDRYLGLLATTTNRADDAIAHHEAALSIHERMRARPWTARSRYDLAGALLARGGAGDRERALALLNDALDAANDIGMTKLVQEVLTAKLELQGIASGSTVTASIDAITAAVTFDRPDLRQHAASDGTVAVLFSDIEGYTALNERLGDVRTQELLRAHDAILRREVAAHRGTVVKSQGDGYMMVFARAADALAGAAAVQRSIAAHDFGADAGPVRVRIGGHVGEVIREGDDFFGRTVIIASRVTGEATGGEILVSDALRVAAGDGHAPGAFSGSREVVLKGVRGTHHVHRLDW
jgi:class 3 adenylate cyclase